MSKGIRTTIHRPPRISGRHRASLIGSMLVAVCLIGSACEEALGPPDAILGLWVTDAPAYKGRYFEVRSDTLTIETSHYDGLTVYSITNVTIDDVKRPTSYTIEYRNKYGETGNMRLYELKPGRLRVGQGNETWERKADLPKSPGSTEARA